MLWLDYGAKPDFKYFYDVAYKLFS